MASHGGAAHPWTTVNDGGAKPGQTNNDIAADAHEHRHTVAYLAEPLHRHQGDEPDGYAQTADFLGVPSPISAKILLAHGQPKHPSHEHQPYGKIIE